MHSTQVEYGDEFISHEMWTMLHNGDYSGEVIFANVPGYLISSTDHGQTNDVRIPFEVLKELVGQAMQSARISDIEGMSGIDYLNAQRIGR